MARKKAGKQLTSQGPQEAQRRFSLALEAAGAGAWEWDISTNRTLWSEENYRLLGLPPGNGEATYDDWLSCVHPDDRAFAASQVESVVHAKGDLDFEFRVVWPDGGVRWIRDVGKLMLDENGEPMGMFGIQIDITEKRALEESLHRSQRMEAMGRIAGAVAHDFNNLLTVISGNAGLLREQYSFPSKPDTRIDAILHAASQAAELTSQLLAIGRRQTQRPEVLDLRTTILEMEDLLGHIFGENVAFAAQHGPDALIVRVDRGQLQQIVLNLAVNARDAMPSGGSVTLRTYSIEITGNQTSPSSSLSPGSYAALSLRDTGHGMDDETLSSVFDPFFSTKPVGQGTGLGLASAYGSVKQSGGDLVAESAIGEGSTFTVYLPIVQDEIAIAKKTLKPVGTLNGSETVLVVENERAILKLIQSVLEVRGYRVIAASNAEDVLESTSMGKEAIDLLLTDVMLPGMNGVDLAKRFVDNHPSAKVLLISGYSHEALKTQGAPRDSLELLPKPFSPQDLERKVREVLD